ncbi:MAG: DUF4142 domain-containing protein [Acidobacteriota bacterium]
MFLEKAGRDVWLDLQIGRLALQRAESQATKNLAQKMVDDGDRENQELMDIAQRKGLTLSPADERAIESHPLSQTTGPAFDRVFADVVKATLAREAAAFEIASNRATDLDVKNWAAKWLPNIQDHLQDAQTLPE